MTVQSPPVLAFGDPMRLRKAMRVVACHGATLHHHADPVTLIEACASLRPEIILFEYGYAQDQALSLANAVAEKCPGSRMIVLTDPSPPTDMAQLIEQRWFGHMLGLESAWFMDELGATIAKLFGRDVFGIWCYLPWGVRVLEAPIANSEDKQNIFDQIEAFMGSLGIRGRLVQRIQEVADEMLMNAVYDAPVDNSGKHLFAETPRTTRVDLALEQRPTFRMGSDGRMFAISISDPFGGLTSELFRRYIGKGLRGGADQIDDKAGGAGLGLYFLFERLNSLVLNVAPGRCTELVGLVDIRGSFRAAAGAPKSLNVFVRPS